MTDTTGDPVFYPMNGKLWRLSDTFHYGENPEGYGVFFWGASEVNGLSSAVMFFHPEVSDNSRLPNAPGDHGTTHPGQGVSNTPGDSHLGTVSCAGPGSGRGVLGSVC